MKILIKTICWDSICEIWTHKLWPNRDSTIEPVSYLNTHGVYDPHIRARSPVFLGAFLGNQLIAVNSLHLAYKDWARSRGLYVEPPFRNQGIGQKILLTTVHFAQEKGCAYIWSFPRQTSLKTYLSTGFQLENPHDISGMEFGPNFLVSRSLSSL